MTMSRILTVVFLALAGCATASNGLTVAAMETYFEQAVFKDAQQHEAEITRWQSPMQVYVLGAAAPKYHLQVEDWVRQVAALTGVPAQIDSGLQGNLFIYVEPEDLTGRLVVDQAICTTEARSATGRMTQAKVTISAQSPTADPASQVMRCSAHEMMHAIGIPGHTNVPSILAPWDGRQPQLTAADRLAILVLYDPRLRPGMSPAEARPIVRQILRERLGA